ncbi:galactokinase [Arcanobacterium pluranimalium]|uniref:galactokinase n=1 Tax=Arcanobacterium pluranimalium TaxID=108028 RepID=UPI0030843A9C|nr:galactokinase [Arcanobacterium pluranimalium]
MAVFMDSWSNQDGLDRVSKLFADQFGGEPEQVWAAPGRVNIIGEHTDYNEGLCLPIALNHRTFAAISFRHDDVVRVASRLDSVHIWEGKLSDIGPNSPDSWASYAVGPAWALGVAHGFDAAIDSCVPTGAGLSSSAAIECAVGSAFVPTETQAQRKELASACVTSENVVSGAATGGLDQSASMLCTQGNALYLDCRSWETRSIPFDMSKFDLSLLVIDTRATHSLNDGQYEKRRRSCEEAAQLLGVDSLREATLDDLSRLEGVLLQRARHVVTEIQRVRDVVALLEAERPHEIGPLLNASHASLRDDYEVSCAELDVAVESATTAGALGARMTGGGFGGSAIALVPNSAFDAVTSAVEKAFADHGFASPHFLRTIAAQGAERVQA